MSQGEFPLYWVEDFQAHIQPGYNFDVVSTQAVKQFGGGRKRPAHSKKGKSI
ncbi:hypothetical protein SAMN04490183_5287 [Pseudomonas corrugata]|uniref:Protein disaggregation chaperone n=1 Tax=Pseudomonas syringae pv. castaneae TaxID=264450 RepID=A0A0N8R3G0_PSESX|nr:hypothetical protein ALO79_200144 [Pseudomonas syringae pv. castaneae]SDV11649.1 hypothetical protein SAMN04490183_5287 [Pseudomonas corrugata]